MAIPVIELDRALFRRLVPMMLSKIVEQLPEWCFYPSIKDPEKEHRQTKIGVELAYSISLRSSLYKDSSKILPEYLNFLVNSLISQKFVQTLEHYGYRSAFDLFKDHDADKIVFRWKLMSEQSSINLIAALFYYMSQATEGFESMLVKFPEVLKRCEAVKSYIYNKVPSLSKRENSFICENFSLSDNLDVRNLLSLVKKAPVKQGNPSTDLVNMVETKYSGQYDHLVYDWKTEFLKVIVPSHSVKFFMLVGDPVVYHDILKYVKTSLDTHRAYTGRDHELSIEGVNVVYQPLEFKTRIPFILTAINQK